ncbi:MAG TPA: NADP-dependent oxidoreductase [Acidimicrobiales bacterium]|nr:NADP-dependent oxidoreductase [Acidimicrobiales bacterium]
MGDRPPSLAEYVAATVIATAFGGPEVLAVVDTPVRDPGPGEVLLQVRAAGTNPVDYKMYSGAFGGDPAQLPIRLGLEAAGVITAVGDGAAGAEGPVHPGDEVIAFRITGGYASEVVVPGSAVVRKPSTFSFEQAGGLLLVGATAVHALQVTGVAAGDTVLIHGASGGVGLMTVQLAINLGAQVIATASDGHHAYLRQLGAEPVTYGDGLVERIRDLAPDGVQAAIDAVGTTEAIDVSTALVPARDRIATLVAVQRGFELGLRVLGGAPGADPGTEIRAAARAKLVEQAEGGQLEVLVSAAYPLSDVAAAHRSLAAGHTQGKIVLVP